jgi:hypothetical protein
MLGHRSHSPGTSAAVDSLESPSFLQSAMDRPASHRWPHALPLKLIAAQPLGLG